MQKYVTIRNSEKSTGNMNDNKQWPLFPNLLLNWRAQRFHKKYSTIIKRNLENKTVLKLPRNEGPLKTKIYRGGWTALLSWLSSLDRNQRNIRFICPFIDLHGGGTVGTVDVTNKVQAPQIAECCFVGHLMKL